MANKEVSAMKLRRGLHSLKDPQIMSDTFRSITWLGIIASVICVVPIIFYDLSEKKHADIIRALKIRAIVQNYKNDELSEADITDFTDIVGYAEKSGNSFVLDELNSHSETEYILKNRSQVTD